jgi:hypothetical protein
MPRLGDYLQEREILPTGNYDFTITAVEVGEGGKNPSIQIKGKINDEGYVIFRTIHPKMTWLTGQELVALGEGEDTEVDLMDVSAVAALYENHVGQTVRIKAKEDTYEGKKKNEFRILGLADVGSGV